MTLMSTLRNMVASGKVGVQDAVRSRLSWPKRPERLNVEITAACDGRCIHCPRHEMDRAARPMEFDLFKKVVDEAAALRVPEFVPNGYGEILTMPKMADYLAYVRSKQHPFQIMINTNGYNMTDAKIELLFEHRVSLLNITIDGATAATAQRVRVGLKTERIERNIDQILRLRRARGLPYPRIRAGMILIPENQHEAHAFLRRWEGVTDYVGIGGFSRRLGSVDLKASDDAGNGSAPACVLPFSDMDVWADGKAVLCCEDWNEELIVGDLRTQTLGEVWTRPGAHQGQAVARSPERA